MDAPKGRYRVVEKDGRLVVIDDATESPMSSPAVASPGIGRRPAAPAAPLPPAGAGRLARLLLRLVVDRWDEGGRAIVGWEWEENGRKRRWDAALDAAQQRRLGRALLAFASFPLVILLSVVGSFVLLWLLVLALPATFWGAWSVTRLQRETGARGG
jgi:hypothetical protein